MNNIVQNISLVNLSLAFIPVLVVIAIIWRWNMGYKTTIYAIFRMLVQLLLIGYVLTYIFETNSNYIVITILIIMLLAIGLVSLPGMKTGPILSGVSPLIAVRYQIMVMCMIFGSSGISAAVFLHSAKNSFTESKIVSNNFKS